ncbi:uncharacterized protein LOC125472811 isoform X2 [Pyrus x bretschneideri]|uniref:uncharacterized protein LOC125472811 isoform X2 n=1 Tax=Pyrus x bretschneideri TaxID=225117 RepID=UPI00202DBE29|nr:uncharacterized protein LOC125472811 isoform X2 [Pyrus x bretschneideri]
MENARFLQKHQRRKRGRVVPTTMISLLTTNLPGRKLACQPWFLLSLKIGTTEDHATVKPNPTFISDSSLLVKQEPDRSQPVQDQEAYSYMCLRPHVSIYKSLTWNRTTCKKVKNGMRDEGISYVSMKEMRIHVD